MHRIKMVKKCSWGTCNSDTRYPERLKGGILFIPFPKPISNKVKCMRWIRLCGRPHSQLNVGKINKDRYVCTKHFVDGRPSELYPDPLPATSCGDSSCKKPRPSRKAPIRRNLTRETLNRNTVTSPAHTPEPPRSVSTVDDENPATTAPPTDCLEVLSMVCENEFLKQRIGILEEEKQNLEQQLNQIQLQLTAKSAQLSVVEESLNSTPLLSTEIVKNSCVPHAFKYYTGFDYDRFQQILAFLVPSEEPPLKYSRKSKATKLPLQEQLFMTLVKLRLDLGFKNLAQLFKISPQDASGLFTDWINYMYFSFGELPLWPKRSVIIQHMPSEFKKDFPNTIVVLDGTEILTSKPSSLKIQSQIYSDYKSHCTLKGLIGVDPRGSIIFISTLFSGAISDKIITEKSGFLETLQHMLLSGHIQQGDAVMVDKGFHIRDEIERLGLKLLIPPFAKSGHQMSGSDVTLTKKIAKHRVHVERAISRIKKFQIVSGIVDITLFKNVEQIWFVCACLTNFMPWLINNVEE